MNQNLIFQPFLILMLLTMVVWITMYVRRIPFIEKSNLPPEQFTAYELMRLSPPHVANPSDNLKNLFELPVLFYVLCFYLFFTARVDQLSLIAAWSFVILRALHSLVHCTINLLMLRFGLYSLSSLLLWIMILRETWVVF